MKASTLFIITVAVLLGVTAVVGAKYVGIFEPKVVKEEKPPELPQVLVARQNLFEGITITSAQVRVRRLYSHELAHYEKNRDKYLAPLVEAGSLRIMARAVEADQPLLREYFQDQLIPDSVSLRLAPGTRAVNVSVPKERAAGGLLQLGEHVDVYLTTSICDAQNCDVSVLRTAIIARDLKIIVKRNNLWTVLQADRDAQVHFTLQANPYRAALLEYARGVGELALVPTPASPAQAVRTAAKSGPPTFSDPDNEEYRDEDKRVAAILDSRANVGEADLERIFKLRPAVPPPAEPPPYRIVRYSGLHLQGTTIFNPDGTTGFTNQALPTSGSPSGRNNTAFAFKMPNSAAVTKK